jgi:hypothetical protein
MFLSFSTCTGTSCNAGFRIKYFLFRYGYEGILNHVYGKSRQHWKVHVDVRKWSEYLCTTELRHSQHSSLITYLVLYSISQTFRIWYMYYRYRYRVKLSKIPKHICMWFNR